MNVDVNQALEAAKVLFRGEQKKESLGLLKKLWEEGTLSGETEFKVFSALVEVWSLDQPRVVVDFLDEVISGTGVYHDFWLRRSLTEQAVLLDWQGQLALSIDDQPKAFESLGRAASLGRDTQLLWRQLGSLYITQGELDLGLRYIRRSLQLFRQLDLNLLSGKEPSLGDFTGKFVTNPAGVLGEFLELLLKVTKVARGQKNLRGVRELVLEMIHQFPTENRLPKIRLLLEKAIVESSIQYTSVLKAAQTTRSTLGQPTPAVHRYLSEPSPRS